MEPMDVMGQGRMAIARDPVGAQFGLWQGAAHIGCEVVNEPGALVRNDLVTATPEPARTFYASVFDFTLDGNPDLPAFDFTFLRRPDGHEIGGIMGVAGRTLGLGDHLRGGRHRPVLATARASRRYHRRAGGLRLRSDGRGHRSLRSGVHGHHPAVLTVVERLGPNAGGSGPWPFGARERMGQNEKEGALPWPPVRTWKLSR